MMRYSCAFVSLLALSFAFSSEAFRLRRTGRRDVAADFYPDIEGPSWAREEVLEQDEQELQDKDWFISSSEEDKAVEEEQDRQDADGSISSVDKEEEEEKAGQREPCEHDAEESFSDDGEEVEEEVPEEQDAVESSFIDEDVKQTISFVSRGSCRAKECNEGDCCRKNDIAGMVPGICKHCPYGYKKSSRLCNRQKSGYIYECLTLSKKDKAMACRRGNNCKAGDCCKQAENSDVSLGFCDLCPYAYKKSSRLCKRMGGYQCKTAR